MRLGQSPWGWAWLSAALLLTGCGGGTSVGPAAIADGIGGSTQREEPHRPAPAWYDNKEVAKDFSTDLVGYGEGATREEARLRAREDIAEQISVRVKSTHECRDRRTEGSQGRVDYHQSCERRSIVESANEFSGIEQAADEARAGRHYIALRYDAAPTYLRASRGLSCGDVKDESPWPGARFTRQIRDKAGCAPVWHLERRAGKWQLVIGKRVLFLSPDELGDFFPEQSDAALQLAVLSQKAREIRQVREGEEYFLQLTNKVSGWLYLFSVTGEGQVQTLIAVEAASRGSRDYPDKDRYGGLLSDIKDDARSTREFFIAALCDEPLHNKYLSVGENSVAPDQEEAYKYGELLSAIEICKVSTRSLIVEKYGG